jgi:hypothetical protein
LRLRAHTKPIVSLGSQITQSARDHPGPTSQNNHYEQKIN